jgi:hypothetical protein
VDAARVRVLAGQIDLRHVVIVSCSCGRIKPLDGGRGGGYKLFLALRQMRQRLIEGGGFPICFAGEVRIGCVGIGRR